jgi:hypothetical protein
MAAHWSDYNKHYLTPPLDNYSLITQWTQWHVYVPPTFTYKIHILPYRVYLFTLYTPITSHYEPVWIWRGSTLCLLCGRNMNFKCVLYKSLAYKG